MSKAKVAIVTDSTCNLTSEMAAEYNIHVIPQNINWAGQTLRDGVDITTETFYERLDPKQEIPTTSQPSPGEFLEYFQKVAETADSITGVFLSEYLSGTYQSAYAGAEMMGDYPIEVVDTRSVSLGLGLLALAAARARDEGQSYTEIAELVRTLSPHMRVMFVVDTLDYLHKGGRIGGAQRLVGSVLSIKPLLEIKEGRIEPLASVRTKNKAVQHMFGIAQEEIAGRTSGVHAGVIHSANHAGGEALVAQIEQAFHPEELIMSELSPVIGVHTGPGLLGMGYYIEP